MRLTIHVAPSSNDSSTAMTARYWPPPTQHLPSNRCSPAIAVRRRVVKSGTPGGFSMARGRSSCDGTAMSLSLGCFEYEYVRWYTPLNLRGMNSMDCSHLMHTLLYQH